MLTEEKLQNFLDDLRLGKYDNEKYELKAYGAPDCVALNLKDISNNIELYLNLYQSKPYKIKEHGFLGLYWATKKKQFVPARAIISYCIPAKSKSIDISDELYNSFATYLLEQKEKIKLVEDSNREATFGL